MTIAAGTAPMHNGQLIVGAGRAAIADAVLVITDGRMVFAGAPGVERIDALGGTTMPGPAAFTAALREWMRLGVERWTLDVARST